MAAENTIVVQIQVRQDTTANWTSANPTPLAGEFCYDTTTGGLKIGDGTTAWLNLGNIGTGGGVDLLLMGG